MRAARRAAIRVIAVVTAAGVVMTINGSGVTVLRSAPWPVAPPPPRPTTATAAPYTGPLVRAKATGTVVPPPASAGRPGAPGLGDKHFPQAGNGGYDVGEYQVDLRYTPADQRISAAVTITAKATQDLSAFDLDFRGPEITQVLVNGLPSAHERRGQELIVSPPRTLARGDTFTTVVRYAGRPKPSRHATLGTYGWVPTKDGAVVVAEPDGAPTWIPVNDHPRDKATYIFRVTVPRNLQVLANGDPHPPVTRGANTTYVWTERDPMASYLAMVAIGKFAIRRGRVGDIPVITAVDPEFASAAERLHSTTMEVLRWEIATFGEYPFQTAGGIIDDARLGYALESQERPVYLGFAPDERFVVHELAHQWFGDSVSLWRWQDIWLNEGFATYAEWLWREHTGQETTAKIFERHYRQPARSPIFNPPSGVPAVVSLFSPSIYIRGAMCLQALRAKVGDERFFAILREWAAARRHGNATVVDFVILTERVSGKQLDKLFRTWLYEKGKPGR